MKSLFLALPALIFFAQFAGAQTLSSDSSQDRFDQVGGYMQMMLVWQERECSTAIAKLAQKEQATIAESYASRGAIGDTQMYVSAKLSNGQECSCAVHQGGKPSAVCQ